MSAARYELLLREGDHRIKNSLQVVANLLSLQARRAPSADTRAALGAASARVMAVARIHDALQLNGCHDSVDVGALIEAMCQSVYAMAGDPRSIKIEVAAEPIEAPLSLARPLLLAVNELVINALRHAFPHDRGGAVIVTATKNDRQVCVSVADNGVGLPPDYAEGRGYGMTLVRAMIAKLGGTLDAESANGARFTLTAPLLLADPVNFVSASHEACGQANARV
ncbi:MAG: sensor histidine kinase [Terricaulis sp.]|nr:sensor histidine kinase [Terricaulis sp.]